MPFASYSRMHTCQGWSGFVQARTSCCQATTSHVSPRPSVHCFTRFGACCEFIANHNSSKCLGLPGSWVVQVIQQVSHPALGVPLVKAVFMMGILSCHHESASTESRGYKKPFRSYGVVRTCTGHSLPRLVEMLEWI